MTLLASTVQQIGPTWSTTTGRWLKSLRRFLRLVFHRLRLVMTNVQNVRLSLQRLPGYGAGMVGVLRDAKTHHYLTTREHFILGF